MEANVKDKETAETGGRFAYEGLDRVIHERARLSVLTSLVTHPKGVAFNDLKSLCTLTDGNLSRHLSVLEAEKMIDMEKGKEDKRPQTLVRLTRTGRKRYLAYLSTLEQVVLDAAALAKDEPAATPPRKLRVQPA